VVILKRILYLILKKGPFDRILSGSMLVEHLGMDVTDRYEIKLGKIVEKENIDAEDK